MQLETPPNLINVTGIQFDEYGQYQMTEIADPELLEMVGGGGTTINFYCPDNDGDE